MQITVFEIVFKKCSEAPIMTARYNAVFANFFRSVFMCAERFCDAKMNSSSVPKPAAEF